MLERYRVEINVLAEKVRGVRSSRRRYVPPELRRELTELGCKAAGDGCSLSALARAVGIHAETMKRYVAAAEPGRGARFVPVQLATPTPGASDAGLALVSPSGWRLEGVDLRDAIALLRELA